MKSYIQQALDKNPFLRRVSILASGTAIGQLITIASLPIITRLYSPEVFSVLAVYVSILTILCVIAGLCFEYAIPLPKSNRIAAALCTLAIFSTISFSGISALLIYFFPSVINQLTTYKLSNILWLIPFGLFTVGLYNALQYWSTRNKQFSLISKTRITQSALGNSVKLGSGFLLGSTSIGLILGQIISQGSGFITLSVSLFKSDWKYFKKIKPKTLRLAFSRYQEFPKFTTLEVLANTSSIQLPIILIASFSIGSEAGYLMIAMQLLSAPMGLLGNAVSQVYLTEAADKYHHKQLKNFTLATIKNLAKVAILPLMLAACLAPILVPYFLGAQWQRAGILISWMTPWFFVQFITSPVSTSLYITKNQKTAFLLQLFGLCIRVGSIYLISLYNIDFLGEAYALSGLLFYAIYLLVVIKKL